ncbi:hypothetical protein AXX12_04380 [Anaerosporomusa subterranea]|uniref:HTH HARE-type domain-containing protein n=1 Tax=Anaerosporomusa subterranea TaxID=1794912 RepID=A0A154BTS5_ANASB|nr:hypothetical protein [Anaerosporomusa subterranea]KYZ77366.1 hypothetical protein AXX12_04380 [Anaerosporomusa subterranea]
MQEKTTSTIIMCDYALIEELKLAVDAERLPTRFTASDIKRWIENDNIKKADGTPYPRVSAEMLSNYSQNTPITKKRKQKVLYSSHNARVFSFNPF